MEWFELILETGAELEYTAWDWVGLGVLGVQLLVGFVCWPGLLVMMRERERLPDWRPLLMGAATASLWVLDSAETSSVGLEILLLLWTSMAGQLSLAFWWWWEERARWRWSTRELVAVLLIAGSEVSVATLFLAGFAADEGLWPQFSEWFAGWDSAAFTNLEGYDGLLDSLLASPVEECLFRILMVLVPLALFQSWGWTQRGDRREKLAQLGLILLGAALFMFGHSDRGGWMNFELFASGVLYGAGAVRFGPLAPMIWHYAWNATVSAGYFAFF